MFVAGTWFRKKAFVATVTKAVKHGRRWKREKHGRRWERDSRALRRVHSTASRRTKSYPESTRETMGSSPQFLGQRTVYAIFGIPGIPSSVAATEKKPDSIKDSALIHQHSSPSQLIHWRVLWWRKARFACPTVRHLYIAVGSILSTDMFTQLYSYLTLFMLLQSIMHMSGGPMG